MPLLSMYGWRITKYNPAFRDERGAYLYDEWISVSEIGESFGGEVLTFEEYRKIENAYVLTTLRFLTEAGLSSLKVTSLEKQNLPRVEKWLLADIPIAPSRVEEGMSASDEELGNICRLVLREAIWCRLESEAGFYIHFGWDYYMYVGSPVPSEESVLYGREQGLFIEVMPSPYISSAEA
jgi:hypothetical protein